MSRATSGNYRFGPFRVEPAAYRLLRDQAVVPVSPKIIDLLLYFVARPSMLVSKDELFAALWPDVAVTDNALTQVVSELRQALGDDPSNPVYVQTVARRGYRFIAPVTLEITPVASMEVSPQAGPALPSLAVLDFTNVSGDPSLAWLSSGIAETVTNDLRAALDARTLDRTRIVEATRRVGPTLEALRHELRVDLAVVGSFQTAGDRLRVMARVVDAATGEALADSKADGLLADVFDLQDRIVSQLSAALGRRAGVTRRSLRETSSLEAYQTFTEARMRLETLDGSQVGRAIAGFERAIALDPRYAAAHVGLGNAHFLQYEMSRAQTTPDARLLAAAIGHVRRAIELERDLAEAHATLAFLLVSAGRSGEALTAARRAVSLEPGYWGHYFRLAHAAWGDERLRALERVLELYPDFPFAHFEAAMVHIARGALDHAESVLREGAIVQDRQAHLRQRYPARGLHWLLGLVRLARGDGGEAQAEFEREIAGGTGQLYAAEFVMNAWDGAGFVCLGRARPSEAGACFSRALELYPEHARSHVGLGIAQAAAGEPGDSAAAFAAASAAIDSLTRGGRSSEASMAEAALATATGMPDRAIATLTALVERTDQPFAGWTIPLDPLLDPLRARPDFKGVLASLAGRAR
jgi:DNA-binding winged helix-turn-helix (wHTH) protein/tetratricopeptide (TPR) repeat protein